MIMNKIAMGLCRRCKEMVRRMINASMNDIMDEISRNIYSRIVIKIHRIVIKIQAMDLRPKIFQNINFTQHYKDIKFIKRIVSCIRYFMHPSWNKSENYYCLWST